MKKIVLILALLIGFSGFSQLLKDSIYSKRMDMKREIFISVPSSYDKNSKKAYPLLVLLDGDYLFEPFYGAMTYGSHWDDLPEMIIV